MKDQRGDTIVEVLIAIAVISLVLVGAYVSTTRNVNSTQSAQERNQAVKLVQTQIEYLRQAGSTTNGHCFTSAGDNKANAGAQGVNPCIVTSDGSTAGQSDEPAYSMLIQTTGTPGVYDISATWDQLGGSGKNNVTMYYQP